MNKLVKDIYETGGKYTLYLEGQKHSVLHYHLNDKGLFIVDFPVDLTNEIPIKAYAPNNGMDIRRELVLILIQNNREFLEMHPIILYDKTLVAQKGFIPDKYIEWGLRIYNMPKFDLRADLNRYRIICKQWIQAS